MMHDSKIVVGGLTPVQSRALWFIRDYIDSHGFSPSYAEIMTALGLRSKSGVFRIVHALAECGHVSVHRNRARRIMLSPDYRRAAIDLACLVRDRRYIEANERSTQILRFVAEAGK